MRQICLLLMVVLALGYGIGARAQQVASQPLVPQLIRFGGSLAASTGPSHGGLFGVTFSLYREQTGGAPLWIETQNVQADSTGHYTVLLGSTKSSGVPTDLFTSGEARWLGVQASGRPEQPRVLLVAVPYALKALDAMQTAMHAAEYGEWKNWYRGDWLTGVYRTREIVQAYADHLKDPMAKLPGPASWSGWEAYFHIMQYEGDRSVDVH